MVKKLPGITFTVVLALSLKISSFFFFFQKVFRAKPPKPLQVFVTIVKTLRIYEKPYDKHCETMDFLRKHANHTKSNEKP